MGDRWTERMLLNRLLVRYGKTYKNGGYVGRRYSMAEHVPTDPGKGSGRIADFVAVDMWAAPWADRTAAEQEAWNSGDRQGTSFHGHEIKVSRGDLLTELRDPSKAEAWSRFTHYWWLVLPDTSLLRPTDVLPDGWGVMVAHGRALRVTRPAQRRDPLPMDAARVAGLVRATYQTEVRHAAARAAAEPVVDSPPPERRYSDALPGLDTMPPAPV